MTLVFRNRETEAQRKEVKINTMSFVLLLLANTANLHGSWYTRKQNKEGWILIDLYKAITCLGEESCAITLYFY